MHSLAPPCSRRAVLPEVSAMLSFLLCRPAHDIVVYYCYTVLSLSRIAYKPPTEALPEPIYTRFDHIGTPLGAHSVSSALSRNDQKSTVCTRLCQHVHSVPVLDQRHTQQSN